MVRIALWAIILAQGLPQEPKVPVPSSEAQAGALKNIREVFKQEYGQKTPAAQQTLSKTLLAQGLETQDDSATRYMLFREAAELAVQAGSLDIAIRSLDELGARYADQSLDWKEALLSRAGARLINSDDLRRLAETELSLAGEAAELTQFELSTRAAQAAVAAAKRAKDLSLVARINGFTKALLDQKAAFDLMQKARKTLESDAGDPAANQVLGDYLCIDKGRWEEGLIFLAKGSDAGLKALATQELASSSEVTRQMEVADAWWNRGEAEKSPFRKAHLLAHARILYERLLPGTEGLVRLKAEKRATVPASCLHGTRQGLVAWWRFDEGKGTSTVNAVSPGAQATLTNGVEWAPGRMGSGVLFNGASSYVSCPPPPFTSLDVPHTVSWWFKYSSPPPPGPQTMIILASDPPNSTTQLGLRDGKVTVWKCGGHVLGSGPSPSLNVWHHCGFLFDGKHSSFFVDGKLESTSDAAPQSGAVAKCEFGRWWGGVTNFEPFSGMLDDIRFYARALAPQEIQGLAADRD